MYGGSTHHHALVHTQHWDLLPLPLSLLEQRPQAKALPPRERDFFIDNLLVRFHLIIVMIGWTGFVPWEFELIFPGGLTSTFQPFLHTSLLASTPCCHCRICSGIKSRILNSEPWRMGWWEGALASKPETLTFKPYRGSSITRKRTPLRPYCRPMLMVLGGS